MNRIFGSSFVLVGGWTIYPRFKQLAIIMRQLFCEAACPVLQSLTEAVVKRVDYQKVLIAVSSGFFVSVYRWIISVPESRALRKWMRLVCAHHPQISFVSECGTSPLRTITRTSVVFGPCFSSYAGDASSDILTTYYRALFKVRATQQWFAIVVKLQYCIDRLLSRKYGTVVSFFHFCIYFMSNNSRNRCHDLLRG